MLNTIDEFIATLDPIPSEVERNMRLITDLDRKSKEVMDKINELVIKYSDSNSKHERKELRLESNQLFKELDSLADDKLEVTLGVYDMIDMHIDRLIAVGRDHAEKKGQFLGYEMPRDDNEPRFCYCKEVSCGNMIACDNIECPIEWFHMTCVQLDAAPKGKWYCNECYPKFHKKRSGSRRR